MNEFYKQFVSPGDLVFDIGANIGLKTEIFLALGCEVVAVEPHPESLRSLMRSCPKAQVLPDAVSSEFGKRIQLHTGLDTRTSTLSESWMNAVKQSGRFGNYAWLDSVEVNTITLDWMIRRFGSPKFIKIDVEGSEADVLHGLSQQVPALCFEFHPEFLNSTRQCIGYLQTLGRPSFQVSLDESLELSDAMNSNELLGYLNNFKDSKVYGDIYARF
jgi:FkbM family methyltransferase